MERYGEAFYSNDLRIYGPEAIVQQTEDAVRRGTRLGEGEYYFWTDADSALSREQAPKCIGIADTIFGDVLAIHPDATGASFLFPRDSERIHRFEGTFDDSLDWVLSSGICLAPSRNRYVEPLHIAPGWEAMWRRDESLAAIERWLRGEPNPVPSQAETVRRIAALDEGSTTLFDRVAGEHRAEVFLPRYEARVRVEAPDPTAEPRISLISFLEGPSMEALQRVLATLGIDVAW
jgi:hypothetical protein